MPLRPPLARKSPPSLKAFGKVWEKRSPPISPRVREKFLNGKGLGGGPSPPSDPRLREIFTKGYDREVGDCPIPDIEAITQAIKFSNNSSPGPDGISFAAWR